MVATKMLISLCLLGLARAAPQLGVPNNANGIVTEVVSALQPEIAAAVAEALRGLNLAGSRSSSFGSSSSSSRGASSSTGFAAGNQEDISVPASYAYEYKVANDDQQTYINHNEAREGDDVTGTYSYVDPTGALITVNYQAGAMGYTQTMERQEGAVTIRSKADSSSATNSAFNSNSASSSSANSAFNSNANSRFNQATSSSSSIDESALINRIIAALGPQITSAVNSAVSTQQQSTFTTSNTGFSASNAANTGFAAGDRLTPLFGN